MVIAMNRNLKIKSIVMVFLLAFVGITLTVQIIKEFRAVKPFQLAEGVNVICTHATVRCPTCTAVERLTRETLNESFKDEVSSGKIVFHGVNYDQPEFVFLADKHRIASATVPTYSFNAK